MGSEMCIRDRDGAVAAIDAVALVIFAGIGSRGRPREAPGLSPSGRVIARISFDRVSSLKLISPMNHRSVFQDDRANLHRCGVRFRGQYIGSCV